MKHVYIVVWADTSTPVWTPTIHAVFSSAAKAQEEESSMNKIAREKKYTQVYYVKKHTVH